MIKHNIYGSISFSGFFTPYIIQMTLKLDQKPPFEQISAPITK